jgi:RNA polymerase sigma-70 factor (ECF subfamily)
MEANTLEAWEEFVREAHGVVASTVFKALARWRTPQRDQVEDLVQDTFLKLCAGNFSLLRRFRSDRQEPLVAYIRTIAASVVSDAQRSRAARKRGWGDEPIGLDEIHDAAEPRSSVAAIEREMLLDQVGRCLSGQVERDRHVFWLYYRHGLTSQAIAGIRAVNLTSSGVESLIRRLTTAVRKCLKIQAAGENRQTAKGNFA